MISLIVFVLTLIVLSLSLSICYFECLLFYELSSLIGITYIVISISWIIADKIKRHLLPNKRIDSNGRSVLITGCDTGFGYQTAHILREMGWHVFATVISETSAGARQLQCLGCSIIRMDVTLDEDIINVYNRVMEECSARDTKLWTVVNNAGVMSCGPIEWSNMEEFDRVFKINVYGYVRIIRQFLPLIRKSKGRIVNISSISSLFTAPGITTYSMTKYAISSLSDGLRREMNSTGVSIIEIIPQAYLTQMSYTILGILDRIWSQTSPQLKRDFGDTYFGKFKDYIKYYVKITSGEHKQLMVPLIDSITRERVYPKYLCCSSVNRLIVWAFNYFPVEWMDFFIPFFTYRATPDWVNEENNNKNIKINNNNEQDRY